MWTKGAHDIEVLKSEVDRGGYDVVVESNGIIRHVQLKSSFCGSTVRAVEVSTKLLKKPGGCIIWLEFNDESLVIERFHWFGGKPGTGLPALGSRISRHSKANSRGEKGQGMAHRDLSKKDFKTLVNIADVTKQLFG